MVLHTPPAVFHPIYFRLLLDLLESRGIDPAVCLHDAGIAADSLLTAAPVPTAGAVNQLILLALERSQCPYLGLELGAHMHVHTHGALGFASTASASVGDALGVIARFSSLRARAVRIDIEHSDSGMVLSVAPAIELANTAFAFVFDALLVSIERMLSSLSGRPLAALEYRLPFARGALRAHYAAYLQGTVGFHSGAATIMVPAKLLALKCLTADPAGFSSAKRELERGLAETSASGSWLAAVRELITRAQPSYPSATHAASLLEMHPRTFQRKLAALGVRYQDLLDEIREEEARWLLAKTTDSIADIALRLGFTDPSNFSRHFKRWLNTTPNAYRRASKRLR